MDAAADSVGTALKSAENVYDQMDQVISGAFSDESADAQHIASTLDTLAGQVGNGDCLYFRPGLCSSSRR